LGKISAGNPGFQFKNKEEGISILSENGWNGSDELVVLNPAGAFITRNWPIENYIGFSKLWLERFPQAKFLVLGTDTISAKSAELKNVLGEKLINLAGKTNPVQAFAIVQQAAFILSEDSGLMHMAWVSGIPTLAMFGSTRSDRATPIGGHTMLLDSSDLPCGNCMLEQCKYGDTHCLTRYTPEFVFEKALALRLNRK
jgi:ADP-heptose:LPS heptosyltransferase